MPAIMLRNSFLTAAILPLLIGCRPPASTTGGIGSSSAVLKEMFDSGLGGHRLENAEILWSEADSSLEYSRSGSVTVKEASKKEIADRLEKQLGPLPQKYKWESYGLTADEDYLNFHYRDTSGIYYLDFILTQKDKDVDILVLSKGVRR